MNDPTAEGIAAAVPQSVDWSGWRLRSTPPSAEQLKPSVLAVVETLVAAAIYAWVAVRYGTLHLTVAALATPFLLLRTPESTEKALSLADEKPTGARIGVGVALSTAVMFGPALLYTALHDPRSDAMTLLAIFAVSIVAAFFLVMGGAHKVIATVLCTFRDPANAVAHVPLNWKRYVFCLDTAHPPEIIPGSSVRERNVLVRELGDFGVRSYKQQVGEQRTVADRRAAILMLPFAFGLVWTILASQTLVATLYRWSIKGTSLIYAPMVWVITDAPKRTPESLRDDWFMSVARLFARIVLAGLVAKLALRLGLDLDVLRGTSDALLKLAANDFIRAFIAPSSFPAWQIVLGVNALLTLLLYGWAVRLAVRGYTPAQKRALDYGFLVRSILSLFVIVHTLYIVASLAHAA